jgi:hypothetical protein
LLAFAEKKQEIIHFVDWNAIVRSQIFFCLLPTFCFRIQFIPPKHPQQIQPFTKEIQSKNIKQRLCWTLSCAKTQPVKFDSATKSWKIDVTAVELQLSEQVSLCVTHSTETTISPLVPWSKLKLVCMVS